MPIKLEKKVDKTTVKRDTRQTKCIGKRNASSERKSIVKASLILKPIVFLLNSNFFKSTIGAGFVKTSFNPASAIPKVNSPKSK